MHWNQFLSFIISMLALINPLGSLAVFLGMTPHKAEREKRQIAVVTTITVLLVLLLVTWAGIPILHIFGISLPAFEVTGGLIILLRGLAMLHSKETPTSQTAEQLEETRTRSRESIAVVPLGIPIIAGPGAMTNAIIFSQEYAHVIYRIYLSLGIVIIALIMGLMLFFSTRINKFVGETGIKVMTRIMGLLLAAIAMSLIINGLKEAFPAWRL